jgi:glycine/D-amino acid oxidase-like deaminating enzyme
MSSRNNFREHPNKARVCVVGNGLVGTAVSAALAQQKIDHCVIDDNMGWAASPASASMIYRPWLSHVSADDYAISLHTLEQLFGPYFREVNFTGAKCTAYHLQYLKVRRPATEWRVRRVHPDGKVDYAHCSVIYDRVFLCAGQWCKELCPEAFKAGERLVGKVGIALRARSGNSKAVLHTWAPFRQIMRFEEAPGEVWAGDGQAILENNWDDHYTEESKARIMPFLKQDPGAEIDITVGARPYLLGLTDKEVCTWRPVDKVLVLTGTAKSGTCAAGVVASRLLAGEFLHDR